MARPRRQHQADDAAKAASDAARVLQQRSQAVKEEPVERVPEAHEEKPEDYVPPRRYSEQRSEMMEDIVSRRPRAEPEVIEAKPEAKPEPEKPAEVVEEAPVAAVEPETTPELVRVKVDGEEYDAPKEDVDAVGGVRAYQIQKATENRLKKSNDVLAENRKFQAEMVEVLRSLKEVGKPKEPEVTDDQYITERIDKMRFGTPEESALALREIQSKLYKPVDPNAIIEQATNRFKHDQAVSQFDQEFQDIASNPLLLRLVVSLRNERIPQQKGPVDWLNFYRAIGNEVRSVAGKPTSQPVVQSTTSGTPSQQSDKEARKAAAAVVVPTASARAAPPQEEKPETRADVIRGMRQKRGLPV